jgi:N4-gp56 family major capsid protein
MQWSTTNPDWQRDYYSLLLLETLRTKSILVPYTVMKQDYEAANSGVVIFSEVFDTDPNFNALTESNIWLRGAHLDSRTVRIELEIHGDILKFSDYNEIVQYINKGDMRGLVSSKIGQNQVDYLDILARNAFMAHPNPIRFAGGTPATGNARTDITATDLFDPDVAEVVRVHLEENEIPGVASVGDGDGQTIVCATTPRVIKDIRTSGTSKWLELQEYAGGERKFNSEVGSWAGIRFVKTNRLKLRNHGTVSNQTALDGATVAGQGASATVDTVYTVGQSTSTRYIEVDDASGFSVGEYITIHDQNLNGGAGNAPLQTDGTQETRRIISINTGATPDQIVLDKPLLKPHVDNDLVTNGIDVHVSIFMGGPGVVYGVGEAPHVITPPKYDDLMMVNRYGWRGFLKMQLFRPEYYEIVESAGSTD